MDIVSIISSVGFPIVACIFMWKSLQDFQATLADITVQLSLISERLLHLESKIDEDK